MSAVPPHFPAPGRPWRLGFEPTLEARFQASQGPAILLADRLAVALGLGGWLIFVAVDFIRFHDWLPPWSPLQTALALMRLLMLAPMLGALLMLRRDDALRWVRPMALVVLATLFLSSAVALALYMRAHLPHERSILLVLVLAVFLPVGPRFTDALLLALLCSLSLLPLGHWLLDGPERAEYLRLSLVLLLTAGLGAISAYLRERALREQFLLRRELEHLARHDALTGLSNRGSFDRHLRACVAQAQRDGQPLALLAIDIDHFKRFNDSLGHPAGDEALRRLSAVLQAQAMRPLDMAARLGGEELALLLPGCTPDGVAPLCERLLQAIEALAIRHPDSPCGPHLSVSLGAALQQPGESADALYRRADALLYRAKAEGRRRAVLDEPLGLAQVLPLRDAA